jgi:DNA-binding PadR family transcriptional regulator
MEESDAIEDSWSRWEFPVLRALARWEQDNKTGGMISRGDVVQLVGASSDDAWKVGRALSRLEREGLIVASGGSDGTPWPRFVMSLTNSGLRRAGAWPSPASFQRELVERLTQAAERISLDEPAKAGRLRQAADVLGDKATDIVAKMIAEMAAKAAGL